MAVYQSTFCFTKGDRVAIVGINGTGKSTLLKILAEQIPPAEGKVVKERGIKIGFLSQEPSFSGMETVNDFIYSSDNEQQQLIKAYEDLLNSDKIDQQRLAELTDKLSAME